MELFAYLDPGSASAAMAAILAALAGAGAWFRTYGKRAKGKLFFWRKDDAEAEAEPVESTDPGDEPASK